MNLLQQPLLIGAWIGLIHAFDADHISTLSSLSVRGRANSAVGYALRWACGHAVAIGALGMLAVGLGMLWISSVSVVAEALVASLLVALGVSTLVSVWRRRQLFRQAAADRAAAGRIDVEAAHAASAAIRARTAPVHLGKDRRNGAGLLMGLLHGGAGSAAVLAILPLSGIQSGVTALVFLTTFSVGVAAGALLFALLFSGLLAGSYRGGERLAAIVAVAVGVIAIYVGGSMLAGTLDAG